MGKRFVIAGALVLCVVGAGPALAADELDAFRTLNGSEVSFALSGAYSNATLTVSGPDGFYARSFSKSGMPAIDLIKSEATADGVYNYEITAASSETVPVRSRENSGREGAERKTMNVGVYTSGSFVVEDGLIVDTSGEEEE